MQENLQTIKQVVEEVMETDPKTRNSDKWLILQVLRKMGFKIYVDYHELKEMPSFESITRCRRHIQNTEGKLIPERLVDELRQSKQQEYKQTFR
jgi:hypothetical protein